MVPFNNGRIHYSEAPKPSKVSKVKDSIPPNAEAKKCIDHCTDEYMATVWNFFQLWCRQKVPSCSMYLAYLGRTRAAEEARLRNKQTLKMRRKDNFTVCQNDPL